MADVTIQTMPTGVATEVERSVVCPRCRDSLSPRQASFACSGCSGSWPWNEAGFLDLEESDPYWGELPREAMGRLLARARVVGLAAAWEEAAPALADPNLPRYALSPVRGAFLYQTLPERRESALDIGAGFGAISRELARHFRVVFAMEPVRERVEHIARSRADASGLLVPVRAGFERFPFRPASFDLIVAVGVLEWVGWARRPRGEEISPDELQLDFLARARELLRPGGRLVVGIENRYGVDLLRGAPDHSGLPYTSLLPRRWAKRVVRWRAKGAKRLFHGDFAQAPDYRTWTYSTRGTRRLLERAGFQEVEVLYCWGSYVFPQLLGSARGVAKLLSGRRRLRSSVLARLLWKCAGPTLVRAISPSCFVVGHAGRPDPAARPPRAELVLLEGHLDGGTYSWAVLEGGRPVAVVQRPVEPERTSARFSAGVARVRELLERPETRRAIGSFLPEPTDLPWRAGPTTDAPACAWRWFHGHSTLPRTRAELTSLLRAADRLLDALDLAAAALGTRALGEDEATKRLLAAAGGDGDDMDLPPLPSALSPVARRRIARGPWGLLHGDFWWGNILLGDKQRPLLCDWEESEEEGWRPFDPLLFALTLLLDSRPEDPLASPWSGRILPWVGRRLGWTRHELETGLLIAGRIKAWREWSRYRQRNTPVQRWLAGRARECAAR